MQAFVIINLRNLAFFLASRGMVVFTRRYEAELLRVSVSQSCGFCSIYVLGSS